VADGLIVSGGGSTAVATAELFEQAAALRQVINEIEECLARLTTLDGAISAAELRSWNEPQAMYAALSAEEKIDEAVGALRWARFTAQTLVAALDASAESYGAVERTLQQLNQVIGAKLSYALGFLFPGLAVLLAPGLAGAALTVGAAYELSPRERREALRHWLADQNDVLTNPQLVMMVRLGVMGADDFLGGMARVHPQFIELLGDEGLELLGLTTSAGLLATVATPLGALAETPVRVDRVSARTDKTPATTFEERVRRIPQGDSQVRIDRITVDGAPDRFEVYIGGTRDLSMAARTEPWDMTSNVHTLAMGDAGSYRAAQEAMRLAGIDANTPVQFVGHSQGALVASALAGSGDYDARGLLTVGGVVSQRLVPEGVPWVAIEHTDDLVPALGGNRVAPDAVLVRRQAFLGETVPSDTLLPAHELGRYRETAAMLDDAQDGRAETVLDTLNEFSRGADTVTSTRYLSRRLPN
jgi:hypothetical protein